ncbi:hypothetical protein DSL64_26480 [Dyadobacter luteus]|jgi:hypothetical protein|uniref:Uncharacterized protein n=1 Tax=Dyadobacter luteus TaxID=2259619 RepID=A0A3D8Y3G3_9BACT|nr:hypothetical protein [Dyadobacter luteus]REA56563.1 hypothetical protein DSL64_26480 [Dyadobacter luteus]
MSQLPDSSIKLSRPFSSDTDEELQVLMHDASVYREKLEGQWDDLKTDAKEYGKQALIIGGVVTTTFLVLNALLPDTGKKKKVVKLAEPEPEVKKIKYKSQNTVVSAVQSLAWTLAMGWARNKLKNYIADDRKSNESSES